MRRTGEQLEQQIESERSWARWSSAAIIATLAAIILASIVFTNQAVGQTVEPNQSPAQSQTAAQSSEQKQSRTTIAQRRIVISVPHRKLALMENGHAVKTYPVAVGADVSPSPNGSFRVVNRVTAPTYYHSGKVIPPGKTNPLGTRWIGLDRKSYGIHGTNQPQSIGKAASHGCIRMSRADLEELFAMVQVGDAVEIHGESDAMVAELFGAPAAAPATSDTANGEGGSIDQQ
jgi:lipoprotein-anchoring transpeptidase ErfK/SrfK